MPDPILLTHDGAFRVHPAVARRLRAQGRAVRVKGKSFRLALTTDETAATLRERRRTPIRRIRRLEVEFSGAVVPRRGVHVQDGRWFRGIACQLVLEAFGRSWRDYLSSHTNGKSPLAFSLGRDPRKGYITVMAENDLRAHGMLATLAELLVQAEEEGRTLRVQRGLDASGGGHDIRVRSVHYREWAPRGTYVGVIAPTAAAAMAMVPGALTAEPMGEGGHRGHHPTWRVPTRRTRNLPIQVGSCGCYGAGLLA